jgi:hypothetical protein
MDNLQKAKLWLERIKGSISEMAYRELENAIDDLQAERDLLAERLAPDKQSAWRENFLNSFLKIK